jgi:hypothetical protein
MPCLYRSNFYRGDPLQVNIKIRYFPLAALPQGLESVARRLPHR